MPYSQNQEWEIIRDYFGGYVGNFLDCGSNEGTCLSNTRDIFEAGWSGLLLDASPEAFARLEENYKGIERVQLICSAIGDYDGEVTFYESGELLGQGDVALVSSTSLEEVARWDSLNIPFKKITVPMISFETLMEKSRFQTFEFISLDIEGGELSVLPHIPFWELQTRMACIEFNGKDIEKYQAIMEPLGFKLLHFNQENLIYGI